MRKKIWKYLHFITDSKAGQHAAVCHLNSLSRVYCSSCHTWPYPKNTSFALEPKIDIALA